MAKERQKNLEILRCLAMMMVVVLHYLGKGNLLGAEMNSIELTAWGLETFSIVAVNCYMLISGYFLCESSFKITRLLKLYVQIWMYSVGVGVLAVLMGVIPQTEVDTHYYLTLLFPVSMGHYWFMTAYVFLYLLLPLITMAVKQMNKQQLKIVIGLLLFAFCIMKSVLLVRLEEDHQGYDVIWYLCVFLVAAYIRKYGFPMINRFWNSFVLYLGSCSLIFGMLLVLRAIYVQRGSFGLIQHISYEYNHIFVLLAGIGLFGCFLHVKGDGMVAKVAAKISPYVLGVYLLHENLGVRYVWPRYFGADKITSGVQVIVYTICAVITVFITGVIGEFVRTIVVNAVISGLLKIEICKKLQEKLAKIDALFK